MSKLESTGVIGGGTRTPPKARYLPKIDGENGQPHRTFYLSGQSIVFKVEGTLFKVCLKVFRDTEVCIEWLFSG